MEMKIFLWMITFGLSLGSLKAYKRWLQNTRVDNPYNWNKGRLPCGNERMVIPDESPTIYLQFNGTISELVLPRTGELVVGNDMVIGFTNTPDNGAACLGSDTGDIVFNATSPREWIDPLNWCMSDTETGDCDRSFMIDSEKIPCIYDDVVFPSQSSYFVDLGTGLNLQINTLKIGVNTFTTTTFQNFVQGDGSKMFPGPTSGTISSINIARKKCSDVTGCICRDNNEKIMEGLCKIQIQRCEAPMCRNAITPEGHCCPLCGAILKLEYSAGFKLASLMDTLKTNIISKENDVDPVQVSASKIKSPIIQMVLTDSTGLHSKDIAMEIKKFIEKDINTGGLKYSVKRITLEDSGEGTPAQQTGSETLTAGGIAGVVIGSIVAVSLLVVGFVFFYLRRLKPRAKPDNTPSNRIQFWRTTGSRPAAEVAPSIEFRNINPVANIGFDNPLYGNDEAGLGKEVVLQPPTLEDLGGDQQATFDSSAGFDNPLYDNSGVPVSFYYDPTKSEVVVPTQSETSA